MDKHIKKVVVFCGSRFGKKRVYADNAERLGQLLAEKKYGLVYGGGHIGLMGSVSLTAAEYEGDVKGILPQGFYDVARGSQEVHRNIEEDIVPDIYKRKSQMIFESDAVVVLPGGVGTLDELFEAMMAQDMEIFTNPNKRIQPIIVVNIDGFYDHSLKQLEKTVEEGFMDANRLDLLHFVADADEAVALLETLNRKVPVLAQAFKKEGLRM